MTHYGINEDMTFGSLGLSVYNRLRTYPNIGLFVCGHRQTVDVEARRVDIYNGNRVHTMLSDYQQRSGGGNGLLRILEFDPAQSKISVKTFSPYLNTYETDADSQFDLPFNMLPYLGQVSNVASGTAPCFTWNSLSHSTDYEWNMELYDGANITIGPVWRFTTPAASALPVTFADFSATISGKRIKLSWKTMFESNNDRFEIERSKDGANFEKIGQLAGRASSSTTLQYHYYDDQPLPGKAFYQIKQVDTDARTSYSPVKWVLVNDPRKFVAYPNPVGTGGTISIYLRDETRGPVKIRITDMAGREIFAETRANVAGSFQVNPGLPQGSFIITLTGDNLKASQKIISRGR
jgi:hypothetical protein